MMSVPDACVSPSMPGNRASRQSASTSSGGKHGLAFGKYPQSNRTGQPAISPCPDGVSLPCETSAAQP